MRVGQTLRPGIAAPAGIEIVQNMGDAWRQVAGLFQLSSRELAQGVAAAHGLRAGDLAEFRPHDASLLPERLCRELKVVQLWQTQEAVCLALADPHLPAEQLARLRFAVARRLELVVLSPDDIDACLTRQLAQAGATRGGSVHTLDLLSTGDEVNAHTVKLAHELLRMAIDRNASDVHVQPFVGGGAIRFRIDGSLRRIATVPAEILAALSRYFKANAGLDPNPLKPQDGRLRLRYGHREIDVRLSVLPAYDGDRIVCRLLDQSRNFSLQNSRFSPADQQTIHRLSHQGAGMVLLTGPTGSGKTSTLYALLAELNAVDVNILTVEDPVEYVLPGVSQIQVDDKQGLSFADALRSVLRQDPDIVLVGEIRDSETARIASQAALTGHLVLSTLHTNDALGTLPRLLDLGLDASILADALVGVVSQRLVRCLCESCRQPTQAPYTPGEAEFHRLTGEYPAYRPGACPACDYTGYRGRLPVIESLELSPALRQAIASGERRLGELARIAGASRRSMAASAKDWIVSGQTSPAEVQLVIGMGFWRELALEHGVAPETLSANLSQASHSGRRMKLLLLSADEGLQLRLSQALPYDVERLDSDAAAADQLRQHHDVIGLVVDTALTQGTPQAWLTGLRTRLAWTGLPLLFVTRAQDEALNDLLDQFDAPRVAGEALAPDDLCNAVTSLLQGRS